MLMAAIRRGEMWHNSMIRLVAHWVGRDWSTGEILGQAEGFTLLATRSLKPVTVGGGQGDRRRPQFAQTCRTKTRS